MASELICYIKNLPLEEREPFARRCGTTLGYLRKGVSAGDKFRADLCIAIEIESGGSVSCESLRPDVRWSEWERLRQARQATAAGLDDSPTPTADRCSILTRAKNEEAADA